MGLYPSKETDWAKVASIAKETEPKMFPCPFCNKDDSPMVYFQDELLDEDNYVEEHEHWFVKCRYCELTFGFADTPEELIEQWNDQRARMMFIMS